MLITGNIISDFQYITNKDIKAYFEKALNFFKLHYNPIVGFFTGSVKKLDSSAYNAFKELKVETNELFDIIKNNNYRMKDSKWWDLIEQIEDIDSRLSTLDKAAKWARASMAITNYSLGTSLDYVLGQNETLERVSQDVLGSNNPDDDWTDIALDNKLREEDYTTEGGNLLTLKTENSPLNFSINSVVDIIQGKSIYGKDLDRNLTLVEDDDGFTDLKILSNDETINQAIDILIKLKKNDNPDFRKLGLQTSLVIGSNRSALNYPVINQQLQQTFASDDSLKNFTITNIVTEQDNLFIDYTVESRLGEVIPGEAVL